jgi:hypothetical protein
MPLLIRDIYLSIYHLSIETIWVQHFQGGRGEYIFHKFKKSNTLPGVVAPTYNCLWGRQRLGVDFDYFPGDYFHDILQLFS